MRIISNQDTARTSTCLIGTAGNFYWTGAIEDYSLFIVQGCAGCTDSLALNYDSTIQYDDGSCIYPQGCTDTVAYNYDPQAIVDDGSCLYCDLSFLTYQFFKTQIICVMV